jgi:soluble lytic murein transglycosylase-like protein/TolA-binding protein
MNHKIFMSRSSLKYNVVLCSFALFIISFCQILFASPQEDYQSHMMLFLNAIAKPQKATSLPPKLLAYPDLPKSSALWPSYIFFWGEVQLAQGKKDLARRAYRELVEWSASDPYKDGSGGSTLAGLALWRWLNLLNDQVKILPQEWQSLLQVAPVIVETRLVRGLLRKNFHSSLPQLEEDAFRKLAVLARRQKDKEHSEGFFLLYLSNAGSADLTTPETKLLQELLSAKKATPERIDLLRGKRLFTLGDSLAASKFLNKARNSANPQVAAEAGLYLAEVLRIKGYLGYRRQEVIKLLTSVYENSNDPRVAHRALYERAIAYYREGKGRNVEAFVQDLKLLSETYPSPEADDALFLLANHYQKIGEVEQALKCYDKLQHQPSPSKWENLSYFKPAMALYTRNGSGDLMQAMKLIEELEKKNPHGPVHLQNLFWLGRFKTEAGQQKEAYRYFKQIIQENPWDYYAIRARMHLNLGIAARKEIWPDPTTREELRLLSSKSRRNGEFSGNTPYHQRLRAAVTSGFYSAVLDSEKRLRQAFPSRRLEQIPLKELEARGLLTLQALLIACRQDALAAADSDPNPENRLQVAGFVGYATQDWPLSLSIIVGVKEPPERQAALKRQEQFLVVAYPKVYLESINKYATKFGLRPEIIYSVIRSESLFSPVALSSKGAIGLFQFLPTTFDLMDKGYKILKSSKVASPSTFLLDPDRSIYLGSLWLRDEIFKKYQGNLFFALLEHNAGESAVQNWLSHWRKLGYSQDLEYMLETARYLETRILMRNVLADMAIVEAAEILKMPGQR